MRTSIFVSLTLSCATPSTKLIVCAPLFFNGNEKPQKFRQHYWGIKMGITLSYGFHENINVAFILMTENANAA